MPCDIRLDGRVAIVTGDAWQLIGDRTSEIEPKAGIEQTHKIMAELAA